mgnify:FL=1
MHKLILKQLKKYKIEYMIVFIFYIINVNIIKCLTEYDKKRYNLNSG